MLPVALIALAVQLPVVAPAPKPKVDTTAVTVIRRVDTHLRYDWPAGDSAAAAARAFVKDTTAVASSAKMQGDTAWVDVSTHTVTQQFDVGRIYHVRKVIRVERRWGAWVAVGEEPPR